jgi:hypothetical protein
MTSKALIWDQMTQQDPTPIQGTRQVEPEITPPGVEPVGRSRIRVSAAPHYTMRIEMTRLGPVGIVMLVLMIVILRLAGLTLLLGFALVGLAAAGVLIVGAILSVSCAASPDNLHHGALPKNWSLLRARPCKPPEGKTSRMLPAFCRGVTRRHKGVALPEILHVPWLGAFPKQALEYVLTRIVSSSLASVSYFTHARSARFYGLTESKAAPGRMPDKCRQRTDPLRSADRGCALQTRGASACGRLHRGWTRRGHGLRL